MNREFFESNGVGIFPLKDEPADARKQPACRSWDDFAGLVRSRNYGVRLGRVHEHECLVVVDSDTPETDAWAEAHVHTPFVVTTGRGTHRYFRLFDEPGTRFLHRDGLTIELKSAGQYVVGPGSLHPSGVEYRASEWSWRWIDIPLFDSALLIDDREPVARPSSDGFEFPDVVVVSERHDMLFRLIRSFKGSGSSFETTRQIVGLANANRCQPPLDEDQDFERWVRRAWNLPDRPLRRVAESDPFEDAL